MKNESVETTEPTQYPEHEKLRAVHDQTLLLSEFYDWMGEQGFHIGKYHEHDDECTVVERKQLCREIEHEGQIEGKYWHKKGAHRDGCFYESVSHTCGLSEQFLYTHDVPGPDKLFGLFFDIDPVKLSAEKDAMYQELRALNQAKATA